MKVTVVPASSKVCQAAIAELLASSSAPQVVAIYRDPSKAPATFTSSPRFQAVRGDATDGSTLDFAGSDVVLTLTPPKADGGDSLKFTKLYSENVAAAVKRANVKKLVYVSSVGGKHEKGVGEIRTNHASETIYSDAAEEVVFLRGSYFMENWEESFGTLKEEKPYLASVINPADYKVPMVSTRDVGRVSAAQALDTKPLPAKGPVAYDIYGPEEYTANKVVETLRELTGKNIELRLVEPDQLKAYFGAVLPENIVDDYVEMTLAIRPGGILERDMQEAKATNMFIRGKDTLKEQFGKMLK